MVIDKQRAYFVCLFLFVLLALGAVKIATITKQMVPTLFEPQLTLSFYWPNHNADELEIRIVEPVERELASVAGIKEIVTSIESENASMSVTLEQTGDVSYYAGLILQQLSKVSTLPEDLVGPSIEIGGDNYDMRIATFLLTTQPDHPLVSYAEMIGAIENIIAPEFRSIPGVATVDLSLARRQEQVKILTDFTRLASFGLTIEDVEDAVIELKDSKAGGTVIQDKHSFSVIIQGKEQVSELENIIISADKQRLVRLKDVAVVVETFDEPFSWIWFNGNPALYFSVKRVEGANTDAILAAVREKIRQVNENVLHAEGLDLQLSLDNSVKINQAVNLVQSALLVSIFCAVLVMYVFTKNWHSLLLMIINIPVCLLTSIVVLDLMGRSINIISLAGLAFAVGMVLDAFIVTLERMWQCADEIKAGREKEVLRPLIMALAASTATTIVVFAPIAVADNMIGQLFGDLAITICVSLVMSLLSAWYVLPLCFKILQKKLNPPKVEGNRMETIAHFVDSLCRGRRAFFFAGLLVIAPIVASVSLVPELKLLPDVKAQNVRATLIFPKGANLEWLKENYGPILNRELQPHIRSESSPEGLLTKYNLVVLSEVAFVVAYPAPGVESPYLVDWLRELMAEQLPDVRAYVSQDSLLSLGLNGANSFKIDISGLPMTEMAAAAKFIQQELSTTYPDIWTDLAPSQDQLHASYEIEFNSKAILSSGLSNSIIEQTVKAVSGELFLGYYSDGSKARSLIMKSMDTVSSEELLATPIYSPVWGDQLLSSFIAIKPSVFSPAMMRVNGAKSLTLTVIPPDTLELSELQTFFTSELASKAVDQFGADLRISFRGSINQMDDIVDFLIQSFLIAIGILTFICIVSFTSFRAAFVVLLSFPFSIFGGMLGLHLTIGINGQSADILAFVGGIFLVGLCANNTILFMTQFLQHFKSGLTRDDALENAILERYRPIIMTSVTSIVGMLPLLLMPTEEAQIYRGLAAIVVGGMVINVLFVPLLVTSLCRLMFPEKSASHQPKAA